MNDMSDSKSKSSLSGTINGGTGPGKLTAMSVDAQPFVPRIGNISNSNKKLSVDAPEFVIPERTGLSLNAKEFVNSNKGLSANAREFIPRNLYAKEQTNIHQNGYIMYNPVPVHNPIPEVHRVVEMLTSNPADFDNVVQPLLILISQSSSDMVVIQGIVDELFMQMLHEPNFRYSGARICKYLAKKLVLPSESYEQLLIRRCLTHYHNVLSLSPDSVEGDNDLSTFALLLGELIVNMKDMEHVITELPQVLRDVLFVLLNHCTDEALGAVTRILKLTSSVLNECNIDIEDILLAAKESIQGIMTPQAILLNSVLAQVSRSSVKPPRNSSLLTRSRARNYGIDLEPIYYDHAGQAFSADEKDLMDHCTGLSSAEDLTYYSDQDQKGDELGEEDDMDPEIEVAFDQFLRELEDSVVSPTVQSKAPLYPNSQSQAQPVDSRPMTFTYVENQVINRPEFSEQQNRREQQNRPPLQYVFNPSAVCPGASQYLIQPPQLLFNAQQSVEAPLPLLSPGQSSVSPNDPPAAAVWPLAQYPYGFSQSQVSPNFYQGAVQQPAQYSDDVYGEHSGPDVVLNGLLQSTNFYK